VQTSSDLSVEDAALESAVLQHFQKTKPQWKQTTNSISPESPCNVLDAGVAEDFITLLEKAEHNYLHAPYVNTPDVSLNDLAQRFLPSDVPARTLQNSSDYFGSVIEDVIEDATHCENPRMIGHMTSALPVYTRYVSKLLATLNQNCVKTETAKTMTFVERQAIGMLHRQIYNFEETFYAKHVQNPRNVMGVVTSGGTIANMTGLWIARNAALGPDPENGFEGIIKEGIMPALMHYGYTGAVVIGSALMHYSLNKAMDSLGLGEKALVKVPTDDDFRINLEELERAILDARAQRKLIISIVGIAGATETGSIDELPKLALMAKKYGIHFHVDAAWGGPMVFTQTHRPQVAGIEEADSITFDGHKQLYMPMGCGVCFLKDPESIRHIKKTANYIIREESYDLGKFSIEGSRPGNALYIHAHMHILGADGMGALVDRSIRTTNFMARRVNASREFELLFNPTSNILLYRHIPAHLQSRTQDADNLDAYRFTPEEMEEVDEHNRRLQAEQSLQGRTFVSRTTIYVPKYQRQTVALRVVIANPLTAESDIDAVLEDQLSICSQA